MGEPIYDEVVALVGFDPQKEVREPWSLNAAKHRLRVSHESSTDRWDESRRFEDLVEDDWWRSGTGRGR